MIKDTVGFLAAGKRLSPRSLKTPVPSSTHKEAFPRRRPDPKGAKNASNSPAGAVRCLHDPD
jgi:hypothetical protein